MASNIGVVKVDMSKAGKLAMQNVEVTVTATGLVTWKTRITLGAWLIRLGCWIAGCKVTNVSDNG